MPLDPELVGDRGRVHRPGAAERHQREAARVDAALDRDHAQRPDHLLVRDPDDPLGGGQRVESELGGEPADRRLGGAGVELDPAGERRVGAQVAEQQVGVGDRRLGRRRARSRRARARRPPSAGRPAARRRRRASRSSRRRRRPCARRPSAAGSRGRRSRASRSAARGPSSTTQTSQEVPPMSRPSALPSPESSASSPAPTAPPAGPESTLQAPARAASAAGRDAARGLHHRRLRQPALARRLAEPPEVAAEQRREVGVDDRGRAALVLAELRQHLVRGRDVDAGQLGAQALGDRALVGGLEVGEQQADRDRLGARARGPRRPARRARPRSSSAITPCGPTRSRGLEAVARRRPAAPASARRGGRGWGGPGARSRAGR